MGRTSNMMNVRYYEIDRVGVDRPYLRLKSQLRDIYNLLLATTCYNHIPTRHNLLIPVKFRGSALRIYPNLCTSISFFFFLTSATLTIFIVLQFVTVLNTYKLCIAGVIKKLVYTNHFYLQLRVGSGRQCRSLKHEILIFKLLR